MPPELAPAIHASLLEDLAWARKHAPPATRANFEFKHLLVVAPCFGELASADMAAMHESSRLAGNAADDAAAAASSSAGAAAGGAGSKVTGTKRKHADATPADGKTWITQYYHFEEELMASKAQISFTFAVADVEKPAGGAGAAAGSSASSAGSSAGAAAKPAGAQGKKGGSGSSGSDGEEEDEEGGPARPLRVPQSRRVIVFPASALPACVSGMQEMLAVAQADAKAEAEAGSDSSEEDGE
jgi:hypothetical protein